MDTGKENATNTIEMIQIVEIDTNIVQLQ